MIRCEIGIADLDAIADPIRSRDYRIDGLRRLSARETPEIFPLSATCSSMTERPSVLCCGSTTHETMATMRLSDAISPAGMWNLPFAATRRC